MSWSCLSLKYMPLRDAIYYGRTMEKLVESRALYRTGRIQIPTPEFFVFYNGDKHFPEERILKLSDAYLEKTQYPMLELSVKVININLPSNHPILKKCGPLYEYSWFIQQIKNYLVHGKSRDEAIISAMSDCEQKGFLAEFLREHGTEAVNMLFTEFNMEDALEVRYEEGRNEGRAEGRNEGIRAFILDYLEDGKTEEQTLERLKQRFSLNQEEAQKYFGLYNTRKNHSN